MLQFRNKSTDAALRSLINYLLTIIVQTENLYACTKEKNYLCYVNIPVIISKWAIGYYTAI